MRDIEQQETILSEINSTNVLLNIFHSRNIMDLPTSYFGYHSANFFVAYHQSTYLLFLFHSRDIQSKSKNKRPGRSLHENVWCFSFLDGAHRTIIIMMSAIIVDLFSASMVNSLREMHGMFIFIVGQIRNYKNTNMQIICVWGCILASNFVLKIEYKSKQHKLHKFQLF